MARKPSVSDLIYAPAQRRGIGMLIMLSGSWSSGKTLSALRLAKGLAAGGTIGFCDTEHGRALSYADDFEFQHLEMKEPFEPYRFEQAAILSQKSKHAVWICDSFSHEHVGPGGLLDMHEATLQRLTQGDIAKRDAMKYTAWIEPKAQHKALLQRLWQLNQHIILCVHAEKKLDLIKDGKGKTVPNPDRTNSPVCGPDLPYAMTCAFSLDRAAPGVPVWLKRLDRLIHLVDCNAPIDEAMGERLGAWARGENPPPLASYAARPAPPPQTRRAQPQQQRQQEEPPDDGRFPGDDPPLSEPPPGQHPAAEDRTGIGTPDTQGKPGLPESEDGLPEGLPAGDGKTQAVLKELLDGFTAVVVRKDHTDIVDQKVNRDRIAWLKKNRPEMHAKLNAAMQASWARTQPENSQ